jgi:hypothetical protein
MGVRYFQSDNSYSYPFARHGFLDGLRYFSGKEREAAQGVIVQIKNIVNFFFRNHQGMSRHQRIDIQKGNVVVIFGYDVSRDLAVNDLGENRCHKYQVRRPEIMLKSYVNDLKLHLARRRFDRGGLAFLFT